MQQGNHQPTSRPWHSHSWLCARATSNLSSPAKNRATQTLLLWTMPAACLFLAFLFLLSVSAADKKAAPGSVFSPDKGKFNILLEGKSIGHEEFEIQPSGTGWLAKGSTSLQTPDGKSAKVTGNLTLQPNGAPISYEWTSQTDKTNSAQVVFVNGVAKTTLQMQGAHSFQQENSFGSP